MAASRPGFRVLSPPLKELYGGSQAAVMIWSALAPDSPPSTVTAPRTWCLLVLLESGTAGSYFP